MTEALGKRQQRALAALPYAEVPAFVAELRQRPGIAAMALEFALMTAARTLEVVGAQWSEFNLDAALWIIPAERMKAGEEHTVFLCPRAVALLRNRQSESQPFKMSNQAMLMLLRRMGYGSGLRFTACAVLPFPRGLMKTTLLAPMSSRPAWLTGNATSYARHTTERSLRRQGVTFCWRGRSIATAI